MLDGLVAVSDADKATPDTSSPEIKVQPADAVFGPFPLKGAEKVGSGASVPPSDKAAPEIKLQPGDAIPGRVARKEVEKASTQQATPLFVRFLRFSARMAILACLLGVAWAAGAYYSFSHSPSDLARRAVEAPQSVQHDDTASAVRQMTDEMRALKASFDAGQKNQSSSGQAATSATIADLTGRIDKLDSDFTAKLSQINEQLSNIEQHIAASHATLASRAQPLHKHTKHLHDAFDPSRDPGAPGAPHPLGAWQN